MKSLFSRKNDFFRCKFPNFTAGRRTSEGKLFSSCFTSLGNKLAVVEGASFRLANNTEVTLGEKESTKKKDEKIERTTETEST